MFPSFLTQQPVYLPFLLVLVSCFVSPLCSSIFPLVLVAILSYIDTNTLAHALLLPKRATLHLDPFVTLSCSFPYATISGTILQLGQFPIPFHHSLSRNLSSDVSGLSAFRCSTSCPTFLPLYTRMSCGYQFRLSLPNRSSRQTLVSLFFPSILSIYPSLSSNENRL